MSTISRHCVKITGFKPSRALEWLSAVRMTANAKGRRQTGLLVVKAIWGALRDKSAGRQLFQARMRACGRCPLFNRKLRLCLNYGLGCGCYLPAKAAFLQSICWRKAIKDVDKWPEVNKYHPPGGYSPSSSGTILRRVS